MKEEYIKMMQSLTEYVWVPKADRAFWAKVFDDIENNNHDRVLDVWIAPYRSLMALSKNFNFVSKTKESEGVKNSISNMEITKRERRMCLSAIEHRLNGRHVTIVAANNGDKHRLGALLNRIVNELPSDLLRSEYVGKDCLLSGKGGFDIVAYWVFENRWDRAISAHAYSSICMISPYAILESHGGVIKELDRFALNKDQSPFVLLAEERLNGVHGLVEPLNGSPLEIA